MEGKVAVLGSADFVMPFSALGMDTFPAEVDSDELIECAKKIVEEKYALVVIAENAAKFAMEIFAEKQKLPVPCVVVVPFTTASTGFGTAALGEVLRLATGINILQDN